MEEAGEVGGEEMGYIEYIYRISKNRQNIFVKEKNLLGGGGTCL